MLKNSTMHRLRRGFTLVELLVTMAVSSIIIGATFASYQMVANQYNKNTDIANMHTAGRAIVQMIERDVRMAGFVYLDADAVNTYGAIAKPLVITNSGNKCCDSVAITYDKIDEQSKKVERIRITYSTAKHVGAKGTRNRLYKQIDILGRGNVVLTTPILGSKDVLADFVEDFQVADAGPTRKEGTSSGYIKLNETGKEISIGEKKWSCVKDKKTGLIWEVKTKEAGLHFHKDYYTWYDSDPSTNDGNAGRKKNWFKPDQVLQNTEDFIEEVNSKTLCGFSSWKMPTIDQLRTIVDKTKRPAVNLDFFPNSPSSGADWWTSTEDTEHEKTVPEHRKGEWVLTIQPWDGRENTNVHKSNVNFIRLVKEPYLPLKIVSINLTLRTKNPYGKERNFKKEDYHKGDFELNITDSYKRDTFSVTVFARNMVL